MKNIVLYSEDLDPLTIIGLSDDEYKRLITQRRLVRRFVPPVPMNDTYNNLSYVRQLNPQAFAEMCQTSERNKTLLWDEVNRRINAERKEPLYLDYEIRMFQFNCDALGGACIQIVVIDKYNWDIARRNAPAFTYHQSRYLKEQHGVEE